MSRTIEQKVVEMRFDNSNFEKNVSQSMSTLDKLKAAIDKTSSGNAFAGLSKAIDSVNFGSITTAIQTVTEKFSVWEQVAIGAVRNIGASISNYVTGQLRQMTTANLSAGFDKYATKTGAIQTIMASIADQDFGNVDKLEYVESLMEKLNWFTDETSFHLTDMISSIGKFTSAGVDLDKASDAMMGIATWASVSGANADTASRVMYQLSQSLGLGSVRTQDWMSVETANMATKEFKELAIQVAKTQGTINKSGIVGSGKSAQKVEFQNFRETLKHGWLTSDVLTETLSQYSGFANALSKVYDAFEEAGRPQLTSEIIPILEEADEAAKTTGKTLSEVFKEKYELDIDFGVYDKNGKKIGDLSDKITELGIRAFKAAQEAKTLDEALGSVSDAASTVWMNVFETIFGNYEEAKKLWTDLANDLYDLFVEPVNKLADVIYDWKDAGGRLHLFGRGEDGEELGAFYIMMQSIINIKKAFDKAFENVFPPITGEKLAELSKRFQDFMSKISVTEDEVGKLTARFQRFLQKVKNVVKFFTDIIDKTKIFNRIWEKAEKAIDRIRTAFDNTFGPKSAAYGLRMLFRGIQDVFVNFINSLDISEGVFNRLEETFEDVGIIAGRLRDNLKPLTGEVKSIAKSDDIKTVGKFVSGQLLEGLIAIPQHIVHLIKELEIFERIGKGVKNILQAIKNGFSSAFDGTIFQEIWKSLETITFAFTNFLDGFRLGESFFEKVKAIAGGVGSAINLIGRAIQFLLKPIKALVDYGVFTEFGKLLSNTVLNGLLSIPAAIGKIVTKINEFLASHPQIMDAVYDVSTILAKIIGFVLEAANAFGDFIREAKPISAVGGWFKKLFSAFGESEVITKLGDKISGVFGKIRDFFRDDFNFGNAKNLFKDLGKSISEFIDKSELLSSIRNVLKGVWNSLKSVFGKDADFSGFVKGFDAVATSVFGFAKKIFGGLKDAAESVVNFVKTSETIQNVKSTLEKFFGWLSGKIEEWFSKDENGKGLFARIGDFFKGIFGSKEAEAELDGAVGEVETFGQKIEKILGAVWNAIKWVGEKVGAALAGIKDLWNKLDIGGWFKNLISGIGSLFDGLSKSADPVEANANKVATSMSGAGEGLKNLASKGVGVLGMAIPTVLGFKLIEGLRSLMSPFTALKELVESAEFMAKGTVITNGIKALGESFKNILQGLGEFLLMIAGAMVVLAFADKLANGNINNLFIMMISFIGEIITLMGIVVGAVGKQSSHAKGDLKDGVGGLELFKNQTAEVIKSLGDVFLEIGGAIVMLAASVALLAVIEAKYPTADLWKVFVILEAFLVTLSTIGFLIAKYSNDPKNSFMTFDKSGFAMETSSFTSGLYAMGTFMAAAGAAITLMASAAAIVIKASGGDVKVMEAAFQGMMGMLTIAMAGIAAVVILGNQNPTGDTKKAASNIKSAATALVGAGLALRIIAKTVIMLGKEKQTDLDKGTEIVMKIGLVLLAVGLAASQAQNAKFGSFGIMALELAASLAIMATVVKKLGEISATEATRGLQTAAILGGLLGILAIVASAAEGKAAQFISLGLMFIALGASFAIMAGVLKQISEIDSDSFTQSILGLLAAFGALALLFTGVVLATKKDFDSVKLLAGAAAMLILAISIKAVASSIVDLANAFGGDYNKMWPAVIAIGAIVAGFTILGAVAYATGPALLAFGAGVALLGVGIGLLSVGLAAFVNTIIILAGEATLFGSALVDSFGAFLDAIAELGPKIEAALTSVIKAIVKAIAVNAAQIATMILTVAVEILTLISQNLEKIINLVSPILDALITLIMDKVSLLISLLMPIIDDVVNGENGLLTIINTAINGEGGILSIINTAIFGETGILYLLNLLLFGEGGILAMIDLAINGEGGILAIINLAINGEGGILSIINTMLFGENGILVLLQRAITGENGILTIIDDALFGEHGITVMIDKLINGETGILNILNKAINGETGILAIIDNAIITLLNNIGNQASAFRETVVTVISEAAKGIIDCEQVLFDTVTTLITNIAKHIVGLADTIMTAVVNLIEGLATSIETHSSDFWAAVKHLVRAIWNSIWGFFSGDGETSLDKLGSNIMGGLGQGLIDHLSAAVEKAKEVASNVWSSIKGFLGINSPSTLMMEIGKYIDLGLAEGIKDNMDDPLGAMSMLGDSIVDGLVPGIDENAITDSLSDALGGISDTLESDDFTPTITPVLDLSEIQNGASQIPGMLGTDYGYSVDTSSVAKSAYSPYEYYDGTVKVAPEETQLGYWEALEAKMNEMVNKFAQAKVVLDTGAVVGGLVQPMDTALGQRMIQAGRGVYQY